MYVAEAHDSMGVFDSARSERFEDVLAAFRDMLARHGHRRLAVFTVHNPDHHDYATDTGYDNGLTAEENEAVVEALESAR